MQTKSTSLPATRMLAAALAIVLACSAALQAQGPASQPSKPAADKSPNAKTDAPKADSPLASIAGERRAVVVPDPKQIGGECEGIVQVANLVYAGTKSSKCFSDHFLAKAEKESAISTSRRFHAVKLDSEEVFDFPLVIMTGEGAFTLSDQERKNLRQYVERGGFLLASSGCSSKEWDKSFRQEVTRAFPDLSLVAIDMQHQVFHTVYDIKELKAKHGKPQPLQGLSLGGRLGILYSQDGLNDTQHAKGCCCCGGNEITNAIEVTVNILAYALVY